MTKEAHTQLSAWEPIPLRDLKYTYNADDPRIFADFETNEGAVNGNLTDVFLLVIRHDDETYSYYAEDFLNTEMLEEIQNWFLKYTVVFHNAAFDLWVAAQLGLIVPRYECTYVLAYCINPQLPTGLGALAEHYGLSEAKGDFDDFTSYSLEMEEYCIQDTAVTQELWMHLTRLECFAEEPFLYLYYRMELPFILVIIELNHTGIYVDNEGWHEIIGEVTVKRDAVHQEILRKFPLAPGKTYKTKRLRPENTVFDPETSTELIKGKYLYLRQERADDKADPVYLYRKIDVYNPGSPQQTAFLLKHYYGWKPTEFTPAGCEKLDKDVLKEMPYELARLLLDYNKLNKMVTTYGETLLAKVDSDGRLRGSFNQCVTLTGRLSSSSPNLQNIPSRGNMGDSIRRLFTASPGMVLLGCDVDSFQVRIVAYYLKNVCGEQYEDAWAMYDEFMTNPDADPHTTNANLIGCARSVAKNCLFGDLFGFGAAKFAAMSGLSMAEAQAILDRQRANMPSMVALKELVWANCRAHGGVVVDLFGRRGVYPDINSSEKGLAKRAERQAFNFLIQSTEASIIKQWLILIRSEVQRRGIDCKLLLQVHDEILLECYSEDMEELTTIVKEALEDSEWLGELPVTGTPTTGQTWFDVH